MTQPVNAPPPQQPQLKKLPVPEGAAEHPPFDNALQLALIRARTASAPDLDTGGAQPLRSFQDVRFLASAVDAAVQ